MALTSANARNCFLGFHTRALNLGPIGLEQMRQEMARI